MKLLLDKHALVWWLSENPKLSKAAAAAIASPDNDVVVSAASGWEMATKARRQRWREAERIVARLEEILEANRIGVLPVLMRDAIRAGSLERGSSGSFRPDDRGSGVGPGRHATCNL